MKNSNNPIIAETEIHIRSPIEKVWQVLAVDFDEIDQWSSGVKRSAAQGEKVNGSKVGGRHCDLAAVGFTEMDEKILVFDRENYILSYRLYNGLPGFVADAVNTWRLFEARGETHLTVRTVMHTKGLMGCLFRPMMKGNLRSALKSMSEELKYYVDAGEPHPKKKKALKKLRQSKRLRFE